MPLDVQRIRRRFPALQEGAPHASQLFFDGPAGTQVPQAVVDAVSRAMVESVSNVGGSFRSSESAERVVADARSAAADLLGGRAGEIVFGPNMTTLTLAFSRALSRRWEPGDRVVVSGLDHDANVTPWAMAAADRGVHVDVVDIDPGTTALDLEQLASVLTDRTRLVAVTGASNCFGTLVDVEKVAGLAHEVGAVCFVDAVHLAPHARIDVEEMGVDALVCSAYKFFGPHVGALWARADLLETTEAYKVRPSPTDPPAKFETGTPSFPLLAGFAAAVDHLASLEPGPDRVSSLDSAFGEIRRRERALGDRFLAGLGSHVRVHGPPTSEGRVSTFAVRVDGEHPSGTADRLGREGIAVWAGHNYALEPMRRCGLLESGGVVRVGILHLNTEEEVDRVARSL